MVVQICPKCLCIYGIVNKFRTGRIFERLRKVCGGSNLSTDQKCPKCIYKILKKFRVEKSGESSPPGSRVFASGEDSRTLRLASQLADLRAVNADLRLATARDRFGEWLPLPRKKDTRRCPYVAIYSQGIRLGRRFTHPPPCKPACRSSGGECGPTSRASAR